MLENVYSDAACLKPPFNGAYLVWNTHIRVADPLWSVELIFESLQTAGPVVLHIRT